MNPCFSSAPFILNEEYGMRREALGTYADDWAVTQPAVGWGVWVHWHTRIEVICLWVYSMTVWT